MLSVVSQRAYGFQRRNRAAHRCRVAQIAMGSEASIVRQQQLVGGDHRLARSQRRVHQVAGRIAAADQFHHHVDIVDHVPAIAGQQVAAERGRHAVRDDAPRCR